MTRGTANFNPGAPPTSSSSQIIQKRLQYIRWLETGKYDQS